MSILTRAVIREKIQHVMRAADGYRCVRLDIYKLSTPTTGVTTWRFWSTLKDVLGEGEPIYFIDRVIMKSGKPFNDGSHIVYVNASHQDFGTALGKLMHDFHCVKSKDMTDPVFARKARELKGDWE